MDGADFSEQVYAGPSSSFACSHLVATKPILCPSSSRNRVHARRHPVGHKVVLAGCRHDHRRRRSEDKTRGYYCEGVVRNFVGTWIVVPRKHRYLTVFSSLLLSACEGSRAILVPILSQIPLHPRTSSRSWRSRGMCSLTRMRAARGSRHRAQPRS